MTVLGDVLEFAGIPERVADPVRERFVTVRLNGGGAVERSIGVGKTPVAFTGYRVKQGQFIYSRIDARNGAFAFIPSELDGAVVSKDFPIFDIRSDRIVDRYLTHFLRSGRLERAIRARSRGATNRQRIKEEEFLAFPIDLPSLPEQRRIAAILDHADTLRAKRRQVIAQLDSLAKSIFHDMFGDPISNDRELPRAALGSVAEVRTGGSPSRSDATNFGNSIEWIKSDNLGGDVASIAEEWLSQEARKKARVAPSGSVLVTCIAGSPTSIGKASLVDREVAFNQQINAVLPSSELDAAFLLGQLKVAPELVRAKSTGGMKGLVNKSAFQAIDILLPPTAQQREFARRDGLVKAKRAVVHSALAADDELFTCLQSRAFGGEL